MSSLKPIHRLSGPHSKVWLENPVGRRQLATFMRRYYDTKGRGLGEISVCNLEMRVIGYVDTQGNTRLQPKPWPMLEAWQIWNKPSPLKRFSEGGCVCYTFYHPAARGRSKLSHWGALGYREHHPHCEFRQGSLENFNKAARTKEWEEK